MESLYIADVAEVTLEDKLTGDVAFVGDGQITGLTSAEEEEKIKGGIGNRHIYSIRHSKELDLNITNATFDLSYLAMVQGSDIKNEVNTIVKYEKGLVVSDGEVTIGDEDISGDVKVKIGRETIEATATDGVVEVSDAEDGDEVDVAYYTDVEGETVIIDSSKFSRSYKVTYRTIIYSTETDQVIGDLYFIFPNASPSGEFDLSLENGEAYTPELEFSVKAEKNSSELGRIVQVPRKDTP